LQYRRDTRESGRGFGRFFRAAGLLAALAAGPACAAQAPCTPAEGLRFICGTGAAEEVVAIPRTRWLIASGLNVGAPAHLTLIDTRRQRAMPLAMTFPTQANAASDCPGPPDPARWSMDGLALATDGRTPRLFAANHGDRRAVEFFTLALRPGHLPVARWTGCATLPAGTLGNAIAATGPRGFYLTSFHAPDDDQAWARMARGEPTGSVWRWRQGGGFTRIETGPISGANGIALSPDHRRLYVSAWSERAVLALDLRTGARRRIALPFLPDNLHLDARGSLLIGGQDTTVGAIGACGAQCPQPWAVVRLDPRTGRTTRLAHGPGTPRINYACGALPVGRQLYITVRGDDRIAALTKNGTDIKRNISRYH
jgi:sugar lactone lactonase YvrE